MLILTTQKYNNFNQESLIEEFFKEDPNNKPITMNKNEVITIKMYEFFVRNAEPEAGILTRNTKITIENKDILNISRLKIAILKVFVIVFN